MRRRGSARLALLLALLLLAPCNMCLAWAPSGANCTQLRLASKEAWAEGEVDLFGSEFVCVTSVTASARRRRAARSAATTLPQPAAVGGVQPARRREA